MDLDAIYKTGLPVSHDAGLEAVFQAGVASVPAATPVVEVVAVTTTPAPALTDPVLAPAP